MSVSPAFAVNGRYDALPSRSAKFNSERDNPGEGRNIDTLQGCVYEMLFKFPGNVPHDLLSGAAPRYDHVKLEAI